LEMVSFPHFALALLLLAPLGSSEKVQLTTLSDTTSKCMDGSSAGFYFAPATNSTWANSWIIDLQGGGECATQKNCEKKVNTALGSSKYFKQQVELGFLEQSDPVNNPTFSQWNRVFIPYCSQDLWTGTVTAPNSNTWGWYFAGHKIFEAVLNALHELDSAEEIILTGESAGGIGVWPNLDYLAQRYKRARVVGAPIAGFYFYAHPYTGTGHTSSDLADFREEAWPSHYQVWQSFVDADCKAGMPKTPWACILSNNSYPYISSEVYIIESGVDQVVTLAHDWVPNQDPFWTSEVKDYLQEWHNNMTIALAPALSAKSTNGVFFPACYIHTAFGTSSPLIDGLNFIQGFHSWYFNETTPTKLQDKCGILCNPTCNH